MTRRRSSRRSPSRARRLPTIGALILVAVLVAFGLIDPADLTGGLDDLLPDRPGTPSADLRGDVTHVRDGDTIEVAGTPVRIANLDCAEMDTNEGQSARTFMIDLTRGQTVACELEGRKSYDREVGTCAFADTGEDLGEILIGEGICGRWR